MSSIPESLPKTTSTSDLPTSIPPADPMPTITPQPTLTWRDRAIVWLNAKECRLEEKMPNFAFQEKIDGYGRQLKNKFGKLKEFNKWLDDNGNGNWYKRTSLKSHGKAIIKNFT